jgi:hypothetical protein
VHQVDLGLAELRAGPRFVFPDMNGASIKPYVAATGSLLADQVYSGGVGGGVMVHANALGIAWDPFVEVIQQSFRNSDVYPLASGLGGPLTTAALQASGPIVSGWYWQPASPTSARTPSLIPSVTMPLPPTCGCRGISPFPAISASGP